MRAFLTAILVLLGVAALGVYFSLFVVHQNEQALVLEFGKPKRVIDTAGLNYKIPIVETVEYFDRRLLDLDTKPQEVFTSDQNRLIVDSFARYRIINPLKYYQTLRNEIGAQSRIGDILEGTLRRVLGGATLTDAVRDKRDNLMGQIKGQVNTQATDFGVEIVDVRIKRADLPKENADSIYERMKTDRIKEANEFRAQGQEVKQKIEADADRQVTIIRAEANRDARRLKGEGDAERTRITNEAITRDPEFYQFLRSMEAYENALKQSRLVISPESDKFKEFFRYFSAQDPAPKK